MKKINMDHISARLKDLPEDELLVDLRRPDEYQSGHICGCKNIPHDQIKDHIEELRKYRNVILYCRSGRRAGVAAEALMQMGFNDFEVVTQGGMQEWIEKKYPVES